MGALFGIGGSVLTVLKGLFPLIEPVAENLVNEAAKLAQSEVQKIPQGFLQRTAASIVSGAQSLAISELKLLK